jgi:hypothetical protein
MSCIPLQLFPILINLLIIVILSAKLQFVRTNVEQPQLLGRTTQIASKIEAQQLFRGMHLY